MLLRLVMMALHGVELVRIEVAHHGHDVRYAMVTLMAARVQNDVA